MLQDVLDIVVAGVSVPTASRKAIALRLHLLNSLGVGGSFSCFRNSWVSLFFEHKGMRVCGRIVVT